MAPCSRGGKRGSGKRGSGKRGSGKRGSGICFGRKVRGVTSDNVRVVRVASDSCSSHLRLLRGVSVWWHHARVSHSYRVDTLASARVAQCSLLILIPAVRFAVRLYAWRCPFFLMTLCTMTLFLRSFVGLALLFNTYFA